MANKVFIKSGAGLVAFGETPAMAELSYAVAQGHHTEASREGASGLLHAQEVHFNGLNGLDSLRRKAEFYGQLSEALGESGIDLLMQQFLGQAGQTGERLAEQAYKVYPLKESSEEIHKQVTTALEQGSPATLIVRVESSKPSQPLPTPPSTQDAIAAYLTRMEDAGAASGYLKVRDRKLKFFARQYPELPTSPGPIRVYLRQFKTADVPTRQDQWKALSALYKFAFDEYDSPNPMMEVDKPRFKKKSGQRLSRDQAKRLLSVVETDLEWAAVTCYFGLRFRRIEAERLRFGDIKSDYIVVQGKERTEELPLLPLFREMLLKLSQKQQTTDPLFSIKGDCLAYHVRQLFKRAGIDCTRQGPHTLRNTAGRLWLTYGGDDRANRQLLRHSNQTITDHYSELNMDELYTLEERHNPMLNLMRELGLAPGPVLEPALTNTTGVRETFADPARQLPELLDQMIALGEMTHELKRDLGGNGHWPDEVEEIKQYILHQASK